MKIQKKWIATAAALFATYIALNIINTENLTITKKENQEKKHYDLKEKNEESIPNAYHIKPQDKKAIEQHYFKSASVKEHQTLAFRLGGWEHWLTKYRAGEFSLEHLTQQEKDHLFNLAAGQVSPAVMQQFIQSGFRVTPKTNYAVINGGKDLVAHQALVMEKLTIIRQHTGLEGSSMPFFNGLATTGVFDRAVDFGYLDVMKYLDSQGVKAEQPDEVFTSLIKGRQPNVENFMYLIQLGYKPDPQLLAIAKERKLDQRNPELFKLIEQYQ